MTKEKVLVTFSKGDWQIYFTKSENFISLNDSNTILECENPLILGFLTAKMEKNETKNTHENEWRDLPAKNITDLLLFLGGEITGVHVLQEGRNGYIENGEIQLCRKDW